MDVSMMESRRYTFTGTASSCIAAPVGARKRQSPARDRALLVAKAGAAQSPTTRSPNTSDAKSTCCALPLTFMRMVVGFLKNLLAWASVRP